MDVTMGLEKLVVLCLQEKLPLNFKVPLLDFYGSYLLNTHLVSNDTVCCWLIAFPVCSMKPPEPEAEAESENCYYYYTICRHLIKIFYIRMECKPKLRTYIKHKKTIEFEEYLTNEDQKGMKLLAKLRSGTNSLRIETGRYDGRQISDRICKTCWGDLEDEIHNLMECKTYTDIRRECLEELNMKKDDARLEEIMFGKGSKIEIKSAIRYIRRAMARRWRILELIGR